MTSQAFVQQGSYLRLTAFWITMNCRTKVKSSLFSHYAVTLTTRLFIQVTIIYSFYIKVAAHLWMFFSAIIGSKVLLTLLSCASYRQHHRRAHHFTVSCLLGAISKCIICYILSYVSADIKLSETITQSC